ncbi:MAG: phytoene desaturase family protein [Chloroflexia bacterium]
MQADSGGSYDAVIVGAGPNGLAAAVSIARAGHSVLVLEGKETIGGGCRSAELTLPGFTHDVCSAIHPLALNSPFFRTLPLQEHGLSWIEPPAPLAHPLNDGTAVLLERSVESTALNLGPDAQAYRALMGPLVRDWEKIEPSVVGPFRVPRHPLAASRFGLYALRSAEGLARGTFHGERARAIFAGMAAHSMMPLDRSPTAAAGLLLAITAHVVGWPVARGGSQQIVNALADYLRSLGGEIKTGVPVGSIDELPRSKAVLFDVTPRQLIEIAGTRLPPGYRSRLGRYRYGPGVFKLDYALDGPVPWRACDCLRAGTVHLGGMLPEILAAEAEVWKGRPPERPFVLVAQQSLSDPTRAPEGKQTLWAYCHVPNGSTFDMTERIEAQIERFAPGFRDRILARHAMNTCDMQHYNPNYIGGDINAGVQDLRQLFTRPTPNLLAPYRTPARGIYICSSATPPGGGVHGMCGYFAAQTAMHDRSFHSGSQA